MRQANGNIDSHVRDTELRQMLEERERELRQDLQDRVRQGRAGSASAAAGDVIDTVEFAEADVQNDLQFALLQMKTETLQRVREALLQLESGKFGRCVECGADISERRLRALPFALRCTDCEEDHERNVRPLSGAPSFPGSGFSAG